MDSFVAILRERKCRDSPRRVPLDRAPTPLTLLRAKESLQMGHNVRPAFF